LLLEAIDALSLFGFTRFRPGLRSAPADEQESFRLGRLRQVLLALTALVLVLTLLGAVAEVAAPGPLPVSPLSQYWLGPSLLAVVFLMGSELGGRRLGAASAAALMVPCLGVALLVYLILSSRRELAKRGLACRWFRVEPLRGG
jgi:hypothetical protein